MNRRSTLSVAWSSLEHREHSLSDVRDASNKTDSEQVEQILNVHCDIFVWKADILLTTDFWPNIGIFSCLRCVAQFLSSCSLALCS